jgi:hypothetical protein
MQDAPRDWVTSRLQVGHLASGSSDQISISAPQKGQSM